jgi:hypothetical protein
MRLAITALLLLLAAPAIADEAPDLHTWGKLSPVKKTEWFLLKYKDRSGPKPKSAKAYLRMAEDARFFADRRIPLSALEKGAKVWIYGKPVERETEIDGRTQIDRQIVNTVVVAQGVEVTPTKQEGPAGQTWLQGEVTLSGQGLHVRYEGNDYKVVCLKSLSVFVRIALEEAPKKLRKTLALVEGMVSSERYAKAKEKQGCFVVQRVVLLDKRLAKTVYPLLLN